MKNVTVCACICMNKCRDGLLFLFISWFFLLLFGGQLILWFVVFAYLLFKLHLPLRI